MTKAKTTATYDVAANDLAIRYGQLRAIVGRVWDQPALQANIKAELAVITAKLAIYFPSDTTEKNDAVEEVDDLGLDDDEDDE